jgi:exodeoxyribonuclease VII small subunit
MTASTPESTPPRFESLLTELETLVTRLEKGELSLEESLAAFERGMVLSKQAAAILDAAELRIEQLGGTAAAPRVEPFDPSRT